MSTADSEQVMPDLVIDTNNHCYTDAGFFDPFYSTLAQKRQDNEARHNNFMRRLKGIEESLEDSHMVIERARPYRTLGAVLTYFSAQATAGVAIDVVHNQAATPKDIAALAAGSILFGTFGEATRRLNRAIKRSHATINTNIDDLISMGRD